MSRDSIAAWTLLAVNIILVAGFFIYIDRQDEQVARLEAERDSLRADCWEMRPTVAMSIDSIIASFDCLHEVMKDKTEQWGVWNRRFVIYPNYGWPPDTLLHKPMKRDGR